jgi:PTH1 family peptidyl-tRNA hydrolase
MSTFLFVGLGNPGPEYAFTRHNIGFMVADRLQSGLSAPDFKLQKQGFVTEGTWKGHRIILLKPTTYMNLSGQAVRYWLQQEKIPVERLLVVTDDLALPYGKLRMRSKGSAGGHNGLKNIQELLATDGYHRLRFGIGDEFSAGKQVDYVLGNFTPAQMIDLGDKVEKAAKAMLDFAFLGPERAMNAHNT